MKINELKERPNELFRWVRSSCSKMITSSVKRKVLVLLAGYVAVGVFFLSIPFQRKIGLSADREILYAGIIASPILVTMFWDRLTSVKSPWFELTFRDLAIETNVLAGHQIQEAFKDVQRREMAGSEVPEIKEAVWKLSRLCSQSNGSIVEINLRDGNYWWPTRLFLLAALADDFTPVSMFVFVEEEDQRDFLGMATPSATRQALDSYYEKSRYEFLYCRAREVNGSLNHRMFTNKKINDICNGWISVFRQETGKCEEDSFENKVSRDLLVEILGDSMIDSHIEWSGDTTKLLASRIFYSAQRYTALVADGQLRMVTGRQEVATRITNSVMKMEIG